MTPSIDQDAVYKALGDFLTLILPPGVKIIVAQVNRAAEPATQDFVVMNDVRRTRLSTNLDSYADALFTGSIAGNVLTVSAVSFGELGPGSPVFGVGVAANTAIVSQLSGPTGGTGTYSISGSPQTVASRAMAGGTEDVLQATEVVIQVDVHGPNSADNAQVISTLFRDDYAVQALAGTGVAPFYADDPKQIPFLNAENQIENRCIVEAHIQINPSITVPLQFAGAAVVGIINVDERYPAQ